VAASRIEIAEYVTVDGRVPFRRWLLRLRDKGAVARIDARLGRVRVGNFGDCKLVGEGVSELRAPHGPGYRVYFGRDGNTLVVLLCTGAKGTQARDLKKARDYWADYQRRKP